MKKKIIWLVGSCLIMVALVLVSCAPAEEKAEVVPEEEEVTFEGRTWVLESYGEPDDLNTVLEDTEITIAFISAEGKMEGSAGCNSYFGGYEVNEDKLTIKPPTGSTVMACPNPEGIMEQEQQYLKALQAAESFQIQGGKLQINCGGQILIYTAE